MKRVVSQILFSLSLLFSALIYPHVPAYAQIKLEPLPIYEQCASLSESTPPDTVKQALSALKDKEPKLRAQAAQQLSRACHRQAVDPLIDSLKDADTTVRLAAIEALGKLGAKDAIDFLRELTGDADWSIRLALIPALASFKVFDARNAVLNSIAHPNGVDIADETDLRVHCVAILSLNQLTEVTFSRKAVLFMYSFLRSQHATTRQLAEQTMLTLKATRNGAAELIGILKQDHNPENRRWAAEWLGKLGLERGRAQLEDAAANDSSPAVKREAAQALAALKAAGK